MIRILQNVRAFERKFRTRLTRAGIVAVVAALVALPLAPAGLACTSCDADNRCHSGDEQGGFLCRVVDIRCGFLSQIFGFDCQTRTCETMVPCDNRRPEKGAPFSDVELQGVRCPGIAETNIDPPASVAESE